MSALVTYSGESFHGLLARWAAENWVDRLADLVDDCAVDEVRSGLLEHRGAAELAHLADHIGVSPELLLGAAIRPVRDTIWRTVNGVQISCFDLERTRRLYSPAGLALAPYHRSAWQLAALPVCTESWTLLRSDCPDPSCRAEQGWHHTVGITVCDACCGDLCKGSTVSVPVEHRDGLGHLVGLFSREAPSRRRALLSLPDCLQDYSPGEIYELAVQVARVNDPKLPGDRAQLAKTADRMSLITALAKSWAVLQAWPAGFEKLIVEKLLTRSNRRVDGNAGATMRFFKAGNTRIGSLARPIIEKQTDRCNLNGPARESILASTMSSREVADLLGMGPAIATDLRRSGVLGTVFVLKNGLPLPLASRYEVEKLREEKTSRVCLREASSRLGLPHYAVEQLLSSGLLEALDHPFFAARYELPQIRGSSFKRFAETLLSKPGASPSTTNLVRLTTAMQVFGGGVKPWATILASIVGGGLKVSVTAEKRPITQRILVNREQTPDLWRLGTADDHMPIAGCATLINKRDAEDILNVTPKISSAVLSRFKTRAGSRSPVVPAHYVLQLAALRMSSSEFNARLTSLPIRAEADGRKLRRVDALGFDRSEAEQLVAALGGLTR